MTETQPKSNLDIAYQALVDHLNDETTDSGLRMLNTINVACSLLHACVPYIKSFKSSLKENGKEMPPDKLHELKFMLDVCNRFKQAEKQFEKKKGGKNA